MHYFSFLSYPFFSHCGRCHFGSRHLQGVRNDACGAAHEQEKIQQKQRQAQKISQGGVAYAAASNATSAERAPQGRGSRISTTIASTNWPKRPSASFGRPLASAPPQTDPCAPSRPNAVGEHLKSSSPYWRLLHQHPKGLRRPRQVITSAILLLILGITLPLKKEQVGKAVQLDYGLARSNAHPHTI